MAKDEQTKTSTTTRPPPAGADDPFEASTVVGEASADILAIVRETEHAKVSAIPPAPAVPSVAGDDRASEAPTRVGPLPSDVAVTAPPPPMPEVEKVELALAAHAPPREATPPRPGLPPAVGITLLFAAVAAVLAAIVR